MKHIVVHDLGREQARRVAEAAWKSYSERFANYSPSVDWQGDTAKIGFNIKGVSLKGAIEVHDTDIALDLDVPFLLKPFKGQALRVIEEEIRRWIEKSKRGEV
jgi:putative polyhydroxyalkanoate system protein